MWTAFAADVSADAAAFMADSQVPDLIAKAATGVALARR
jgi:hypothetical protein